MPRALAFRVAWTWCVCQASDRLWRIGRRGHAAHLEDGLQDGQPHEPASQPMWALMQICFDSLVGPRCFGDRVMAIWRRFGGGTPQVALSHSCAGRAF